MYPSAPQEAPDTPVNEEGIVTSGPPSAGAIPDTPVNEEGIVTSGPPSTGAI